MNFATVLLLCACLPLGLAAHTADALNVDEDPEADEGADLHPMEEVEALEAADPLEGEAAEQLPRLRFDGTLKTVEDYMALAHAKYLEVMRSQGGPKALKDALPPPKTATHTLYIPEMLADNREEALMKLRVPKGPCLENTPDFLCTVQLVPGGKRHIVSKKELEEDLQEADDNYRGFTLPFCCSGKASRMMLN